MSEATMRGLPSESIDGNFMLAFPAGIILPWWSSNDLVPKGWAVCDGREAVGSDGKSYPTPDLRAAFLRGVSSVGEQTPGGETSRPGSDEASLSLAHNHTGITKQVHSERIRYDRGGDNNGVWYDHAHSIASDLGQVSVPTVPKHWRARFIVRLP